jgi:DNA-binding MarR family transcriptional regulator
MSTSKPTDLIQAIGIAISRWQDATALFDEEFGSRENLSASERQCLSCLAHGPRPARDIAAATRLTRAAVTTLVDRLEARGLVRRTPGDTDRRQVLVAMTPKAEALAERYYGPIVAEGMQILSRFSADEQAIILRFVEEALGLQLAQVDRLRQTP